MEYPVRAGTLTRYVLEGSIKGAGPRAFGPVSPRCPLQRDGAVADRVFCTCRAPVVDLWS